MKHNRILILLISSLLLILVFASCKQHGEGYQITVEKDYDLKEKAIAGDRKAYNELVSYYNGKAKYHESFLTSFVVANKHENAKAYLELYYSIVHNPEYYTRSTEELINNLDRKNRYYAFYYLLKSYELGYRESTSQCAEVFSRKTGFPKSGIYLDSIMAVSR